MRAALRWALRIILAGAAMSVILIAVWRHIPPVSTLMLLRWLTGQSVERQWVPFEAISPHLVRAVIASEDNRFCSHGGIDWDSLRAVMTTRGGPRRGASTLTMQVAKNLFLWHGRSYVRKALELPLALLIDVSWPKRRIIEVYLNIAEWGPGRFGAEAAARHAFSRPAHALTPHQAVLMATALPNPLHRDPAAAGPGHRRLAAVVATRMRRAPGTAACLLP